MSSPRDLGYRIGAVLGGGLAPLIAASLYEATRTSLSISAYLTVMALITPVSAYLLSETHRPREAVSGAPPPGDA